MTVTRYAIQRAEDGAPFMAYNEADGSLMGVDVDPLRAFGKLMRKVQLRDKLASLPVGARVVVNEGMGNTAFGIVSRKLTADGRLGVKYDGLVGPQGSRTEPFEIYVGIDYIQPDPDQEGARSDSARMRHGFHRIEATL